MIDMIVLGILLLGLYMGWRKGLIRMVSGFIGLIFGLFVAFNFSGNFGVFLDKQFDLVTKGTAYFSEHLPLPESVTSLQSDLIPAEQLIVLMNQGKTPEPYQEEIIASAQKFLTTSSEFQNLGEIVAHFMSLLLTKVFAFILLLIITIILLKILGYLLSKGLDRTLIGRVNRILGACLGLISMVVLSGVLLTLVLPVLSLISLGGTSPWGDINTMVNESRFALPAMEFLGEYIIKTLL